MKVNCIVVLMCACIAAFSGAQVTSDFSLSVNPMMDIPMGPTLADGTALFSIGGGISMKAEYSLPFAQFVYTGLVFDANIAPTNNASTILTLLSLGPEVGVQFFPSPRIGIRLAGYGGFYAGMYSPGTVINGFAGGSADFDYLVSSSFSIGFGASYKSYFTPAASVYNGLGLRLGATYHIGAEDTGGSLWVTPKVSPIFPLFYGYYDKNSAGSLVIKNTSPGAVQEVSVSFFVKQYMDAPKVCWSKGQLARDEERTIPLLALFSNSIFGITEQTTVAGVIEITYKYLGQEVKSSYPVSVSINNRNAMAWDDTRKASAFVTSNDPAIRSLVARVVPDARSKGTPAINANFRSAIALFEAMRVYGVRYIPDPKPFASKVANTQAVDYLQFASQTLQVKAGDCDDLSILYVTLLEAAGIETAFITVPGHIYAAFDTGLDTAGAKVTFGKPDDLIIAEDRVWLPVEITRVSEGFMKAWQTGAQEWRAGTGNKVAAIYPVHKSWEIYSPANVGDFLKTKVDAVNATSVFAAYSGELGNFFEADFKPRIAALQADIARKADPKLQNKLGVLYARFGMYAEAAQQFNAVIRQSGDSASAFVNLGNISYLKADYKGAVALYNRALAVNPVSSAALRALIYAAYELGDSEAVQVAYAKLKSSDKAAAERLASFDTSKTQSAGTERAASFDKEVSSWTEE
jgi:transglutaminase-like putative cysteine protease